MFLLSYPDGSTASVSYLANASAELPKERFEVHCDGRSARCDNYRTTELPGGEKVKGINQDKGQDQALRATISALRSGAPSPISLREIIQVSRATQAIEDSIRSGAAEMVGS